MKKTAGWMALLMAAAALATPVLAHDRDDYGCNRYTGYTVVRHDRDIRERHEVRRDVRPVQRDYRR